MECFLNAFIVNKAETELECPVKYATMSLLHAAVVFVAIDNSA